MPLPTLWDKSYDSLITEVINNSQYVTQYGNIEDENITDENLKEIPSLMWGLYSEKEKYCINLLLILCNGIYDVDNTPYYNSVF